jgi:hypothetical protein
VLCARIQGMPTRVELHEEVDALPEPQLPAARLVVDPDAEKKRKALLKRFAARFTDPDNAGIDWDLLRDVKRHAWPIR